MGYEAAVDYQTTTDKNNTFFTSNDNRKSLGQMHAQSLANKKERVAMNRIPHYNFGRD